jgi:hypothetical protein
MILTEVFQYSTYLIDRRGPKLCIRHLFAPHRLVQYNLPGICEQSSLSIFDHRWLLLASQSALHFYHLKRLEVQTLFLWNLEDHAFASVSRESEPNKCMKVIGCYSDSKDDRILVEEDNRALWTFSWKWKRDAQYDSAKKRQEARLIPFLRTRSLRQQYVFKSWDGPYWIWQDSMWHAFPQLNTQFSCNGPYPCSIYSPSAIVYLHNRFQIQLIWKEVNQELVVWDNLEGNQIFIPPLFINFQSELSPLDASHFIVYQPKSFYILSIDVIRRQVLQIAEILFALPKEEIVSPFTDHTCFSNLGFLSYISKGELIVENHSLLSSSLLKTYKQIQCLPASVQRLIFEYSSFYASNETRQLPMELIQEKRNRKRSKVEIL